jgi:predicted TIM-barrel fold metal-dependent hydrolase
MATQIARIVDAHIHLWDPARTDWYPYLSGGQELDMGDISGMCRRFDLDTYFSESAKWNVEKLVHVSAAGRFIADETREREEMAQAAGHPDAIVGGIVPEQSVAETVALLDDQMASPHFRGVRCMGFVPGGVPEPNVLRALQERNLVFDLMVHTDELQPAASALAGWGDLTVVVEHAGWPRTNTSDELALWMTGMSALAAVGGNVHCKLSGLAMPLGSMDAAVFERWVEYALEVFGVDRCFFASNFPVDSMHGTFDELYSTFDTLTADLDAVARDKLFAANAERVYRC